MTDYKGTTAGSVVEFDVPSNAELEKKAYKEMPTITKIMYDVGTHLRCLKIFLSDGTESQKSGGFELENTKELNGEDIGKIKTCLKGDGKIG
jgi:hypothetical protein